jgi:POT family proton-dependent oligopeptide transporter
MSENPKEGAQFADRSGFWGHPQGLSTLFMTEMWERFSFYGMRAILLLFMVAPAVAGGLGMSDEAAGSLLGTYIMGVYLACIPGGLIADKWIGARRAVLIGGIVIACGHFVMMAHGVSAFYLGLALIVVGTGLLKPSISNMLGGLYSGKDDPRRDTGFSLFYLGINIGAFMAPLVCGFLAQSEWFKTFLVNRGFDPNASWHWGFGAAGVGMLLGLAQYLWQSKRFGSVGLPVKRNAALKDAERLTAADWKRMGAIGILFVFTVFFFAVYEQGSSSLGLFADRLTNNTVPLLGWTFPSSWFQSINPLFIVLLTPVFGWLWPWLEQRNRQPSAPAKFAFGLLFVSFAIGLMVVAAWFTAAGKVTPLWLCGFFFLECVGEMCLSPVGLSTVTRLAPARFSGLMLGVWFLASALGGKLAGVLASFFKEDTQVMMILFGSLAISGLIATAVLTYLTPTVRKLMGSEPASGPSH